MVAPPAIRACSQLLERELELLRRVEVVVALGGYAYAHILRILSDRGAAAPSPRPKFSHGLELSLGRGPRLLVSYHPSQQNTFTGRLTEPMFDAIWRRALALRREESGAETRRG